MKTNKRLFAGLALLAAVFTNSAMHNTQEQCCIEAIKKELLCKDHRYAFTALYFGEKLFTTFDWSELYTQDKKSGNFNIVPTRIFFDNTDTHVFIWYTLEDYMEHGPGHWLHGKLYFHPEIILINTTNRKSQNITSDMLLPCIKSIFSDTRDVQENAFEPLQEREHLYPLQLASLNRAQTMLVAVCDNGIIFLATRHLKPTLWGYLDDVSITFE